MSAFWIILTGSLVAVCCSVLGSLLLLKKASMLGDAISHAVLPGIVIAFMITGSRNSGPALLGAAAVGVLTTYMIQWLSNRVKMQGDASIGLSYTLMFALGVLLISGGLKNVDLDQECVLYGEIGFVPFDILYSGSGRNLGPRAPYIMGTTFLLILALIRIGYRSFKVSIFNPDYAASIGIPVLFWHYALMGGVSLTTVVSFELVGAILVVAFLTIPAAAAFLITRRLYQMLVVASIFGILAAVGGYYTAIALNTSISASMAMCSFVIFLVVVGVEMVRRRV